MEERLFEVGTNLVQAVFLPHHSILLARSATGNFQVWDLQTRTFSRELLLAGKTDAEIRDHLVARYGDFILFRPQFAWRNAWLWGAPVLLMIIGVLVALRIVRGRAALADQPDEEPDARS